MPYQKVTIHTADGSHRRFECQFKNNKQYESFMEKYGSYPGYLIFEFDLWETSKKSFGLPNVSADYAGFSKVVNALLMGEKYV